MDDPATAPEAQSPSSHNRKIHRKPPTTDGGVRDLKAPTLPADLAQLLREPMVPRLTAGGRRIRTFGSWLKIASNVGDAVSKAEPRSAPKLSFSSVSPMHQRAKSSA